ncbi:MAG: hypothetical protein IPK80_09320 [Nannocystis sp.]|nr:hypothetical protein [Nannocystis sp.]
MTAHTALSSTLAAGLLLGALSPASCTQPASLCTTGHGAYAARYTLEEGDPSSECGALVGDLLGMQTYYGEKDGLPDFSRISVAIRAALIGDLVQYAADRGVADLDPKSDANAFGGFTSQAPGADEFCQVEAISASINLPEIPGVPGVEDDPDTEEDETVDELPPQDAAAITMEWKNARFLVNAGAQGTQFEADLKYTRNGCVAEYHVVGVYPAVECEADADCDDPSNGINPDFALECATELGLCVLKGELPAYK